MSDIKEKISKLCPVAEFEEGECLLVSVPEKDWYPLAKALKEDPELNFDVLSAVVGNSTEVKNAVIFEGVQVPHYNYVGDSVLGYKAHMGAGAITSNIKADKTNVVVKGNGYALATGLRKMGAMLGDYTDIGCNSVLNPGTIVGRNTNVYPLSMLRGVIPADSIYKGKNEIAAKKKTFD